MNKALIIDDDLGFRDIMRIVAKKQGWEVVTSAGWRNEKEALLAEEYKFVICDYKLRSGTAIDLLEFLEVEHIKTPVIVISASEDETYREFALDSGAKAFYDRTELHLKLLYEWFE